MSKKLIEAMADLDEDVLLEEVKALKDQGVEEI
jgi:hypothetical protein